MSDDEKAQGVVNESQYFKDSYGRTLEQVKNLLERNAELMRLLEGYRHRSHNDCSDDFRCPLCKQFDDLVRYA